MSFFDYFINFVEGFILSSFVAYYFDLRKKARYISTITIIYLIGMSISNSYNQFDSIIILFTIGILFFFIYVYEGFINIETILISTISFIMLFLANLVSLFIVSSTLNISTIEIYNNQSLLGLSIILSKILFIIIAVFFCYIRSKDKNKTPLSGGGLYLILSLIIVVIVIILFEFLFTGRFNNFMAIAIIVSLIVIIILFLTIFRKIQIDHNNKIAYELELQKNKFSKENFDRMRVMSNHIDETEHRMTYILMKIKHYIEMNEIDKANCMLDQYIKKVKKFSSVVNTNNPYFDFMINAKMSEYIYEDIYLKTTLFIFENEIFNNVKFCELVLNILDLFKEHLETNKGFSLGIHQENSFIMIEVMGELTSLELSEEIFKYFKYFNLDYSINNVENIYTLKLIIEL